jgi:hypothetical protein
MGSRLTRRSLRLGTPPAWLGAMLVAACGGSGDEGAGAPTAIGHAGATAAAPAPAPPPAAGPMTQPAPSAPVVVPPPVLRFDDTGISITDGLTTNGRWTVGSPLDGLGWEYSLDLGRTWIRGEGDSFEVIGDGAKIIWVRTFDVVGNRSEIVMATCTLDTMPPAPPTVGVVAGPLPTVRIAGLEANAVWEYSVDAQRTWIRGSGSSLTLVGNQVRTLWTRQSDAAGNASPAVPTALDEPLSAGWVEPSGDPLAPTVLPSWEGTLLLHGVISRPDMDFVRFDVPSGLRLRSLRLVHYESADPIAFYAVQQAPVFDAGTQVQRMLAWGHVGPPELRSDLLASIPSASRGAGPYTVWMNQTGGDPTAYAIELTIGPP